MLSALRGEDDAGRPLRKALAPPAPRQDARWEVRSWAEYSTSAAASWAHARPNLLPFFVCIVCWKEREDLAISRVSRSGGGGGGGGVGRSFGRAGRRAGSAGPRKKQMGACVRLLVMLRQCTGRQVSHAPRRLVAISHHSRPALCCLGVLAAVAVRSNHGSPCSLSGSLSLQSRVPPSPRDARTLIPLAIGVCGRAALRSISAGSRAVGRSRSPPPSCLLVSFRFLHRGCAL